MGIILVLYGKVLQLIHTMEDNNYQNKVIIVYYNQLNNTLWWLP